jgi:hypothetical protein
MLPSLLTDSEDYIDELMYFSWIGLKHVMISDERRSKERKSIIYGKLVNMQDFL